LPNLSVSGESSRIFFRGTRRSPFGHAPPAALIDNEPRFAARFVSHRAAFVARVRGKHDAAVPTIYAA
jgi:hypothetical protein